MKKYRMILWPHSGSGLPFADEKGYEITIEQLIGLYEYDRPADEEYRKWLEANRRAVGACYYVTDEEMIDYINNESSPYSIVAVNVMADKDRNNLPWIRGKQVNWKVAVDYLKQHPNTLTYIKSTRSKSSAYQICSTRSWPQAIYGKRLKINFDEVHGVYELWGMWEIK